jgi:hypothetical protein
MNQVTKTRKAIITEKMSVSWIDKLKARWNVTSGFQVIIILTVFAATGFTVMFIKAPITNWITGGESSTLFSISYWILILPVYNLILLVYGFLFGQFRFFWEFEKRFFSRIFGRKK